jgi:uncharacterized membrane protein YGL010W
VDLHAFFRRQLALYASYHRNPRNRGTHFIGIPAIIFSLLCPLALWKLQIAGVGLNGAWLIGILALLGWIALDLGVGLLMSLMLLPMLLAADWIVGRGSPVAAWAMFLLFFVGGWIFQIVGHMWEGRRPALVDNLFQIFIAPMFIVAEILIMFGQRKDLRDTIETAGAAHRASA